MTAAALQLEHHRPALLGHCYRMLGSPADADDAVQETMLRALRGLEGFAGNAALKTWLYRIATNVCLDAIAAKSRRARPIEDGPRGTVDDDLVERPRTHWLEPVPEAHVIPADVDPAERAALRQSIRLAFVAALQHLPAKQRAALLLTEVVGYSVAEVAEALDTSVPAINSALQRARSTLATRDISAGKPLDEAQQGAVEQYLAAFERYDVDTLASLLTRDAVLSMPPYTMWLQGPDAIKAWLLGRGGGCRGSVIRPVAANGMPAFAQWRDGGATAFALVVLEPAGDKFSAMTSFLDVQTLFPRFGLPLSL
jgi:RNA polymerase sigma-70 factor (ECF subfamily)